MKRRRNEYFENSVYPVTQYIYKEDLFNRLYIFTEVAKGGTLDKDNSLLLYL